MKARIAFLSILMLQIVAGCDSDTSKEIHDDTSQAFQEAQNHLAQNKEQYIKKIEAELAALDRQIKQLNEKAEQAGARTRVETMNEITELLEKQDGLHKNLELLKTASSRSIKEAQRQIDTMLEDLKKSYKKAVSRFE